MDYYSLLLNFSVFLIFKLQLSLAANDISLNNETSYNLDHVINKFKQCCQNRSLWEECSEFCIHYYVNSSDALAINVSVELCDCLLHQSIESKILNLSKSSSGKTQTDSSKSFTKEHSQNSVTKNQRRFRRDSTTTNLHYGIQGQFCYNPKTGGCSKFTVDLSDLLCFSSYIKCRGHMARYTYIYYVKDESAGTCIESTKFPAKEETVVYNSLEECNDNQNPRYCQDKSGTVDCLPHQDENHKYCFIGVQQCRKFQKRPPPKYFLDNKSGKCLAINDKEPSDYVYNSYSACIIDNGPRFCFNEKTHRCQRRATRLDSKGQTFCFANAAGCMILKRTYQNRYYYNVKTKSCKRFDRPIKISQRKVIKIFRSERSCRQFQNGTTETEELNGVLVEKINPESSQDVTETPTTTATTTMTTTTTTTKPTTPTTTSTTTTTISTTTTKKIETTTFKVTRDVANQLFHKCCINHKIPQQCADDICSYDSTPEKISSAYKPWWFGGNGFCDPVKHMKPRQLCISNGKNNEQCCKSKISSYKNLGVCKKFCNPEGELEYNWPSSLIDAMKFQNCAGFHGRMNACHYENATYQLSDLAKLQ